MANDDATRNWWMYHGDPAHSGLVVGSTLNSSSIKATAADGKQRFRTLHSIELEGCVLSVPAVVDGFVYVGTANSHAVKGSIGGSFYKINVETGQTEATFEWVIALDERDAHGFAGMGCTPAVTKDKVFFSAFNGKLYCLDAGTLDLIWVTDLRHRDLAHNQPVENTLGTPGYPVVAGWSSPVVVNGKVYVGIGEGENPFAYSFVYCLDAETGSVVWVFCTCKFEADRHNSPNELPAQVAPDPPPPGFTLFTGRPVALGASVWSSIAYDAASDTLFCATGNPQPDPGLPKKREDSQDYSYGLLALDAGTGTFKGIFRALADSNYRPSDVDIDFGGSPTIFARNGQRVVGLGCKNGTYFIVDAETMKLVKQRQLLPYLVDGAGNRQQIATVDPHTDSSELNPPVTNEVSNATPAENFHGTYSTAAIYPERELLFVGLGGNNYNTSAPGIDFETTPFMRALDWNTLADAWHTEGNPARYTKPVPPMYTTAGEAGLSSPAVVGDVVFCSTSKVSVYAFKADDGTLLWHDDLGTQTLGYNGGYGYCMGPAIAGDYVVAGALIFGRKGGILRIYGLHAPPS